MQEVRRTRFAPSPTGFMHIGNLRSALYAYLISKRKDGKFVLRIEDTDRKRIVDGAIDVIYDTLKECGLKHDEGPDIGGEYGPYMQSERLDHYLPYAQKLVEDGKAYYCFCQKEAEAELSAEETAGDGTHECGEDCGSGDEKENPNKSFRGYSGKCRNIDPAEAKARVEAGEPYVIRQKMPQEGETSFDDLVFGKISVDNKELEDQILIKSDGYPTYNFANVIDDHEMGITHVARGCEYLSSTPKYNLLYDALGWQKPEYVHLPLIMGSDGKKLSKRHGATSFGDLTALGYLPEAIINYIALLGWSPGDTREIFSLEELCEHFDEARINKSPAVFDYEKLNWVNEQYIKAMDEGEFKQMLQPWLEKYCGDACKNLDCAAKMLQGRISKFSDLEEMFAFIEKPAEFDVELYKKKRQKINPEVALKVLEHSLPLLEEVSEDNWNEETLGEIMRAQPEKMEIKMGTYMGPLRLALTNMNVTPGGPDQLASVLGRAESLKRIKQTIEDLKGAIESAE